MSNAEPGLIALKKAIEIMILTMGEDTQLTLGGVLDAIKMVEGKEQ